MKLSYGYIVEHLGERFTILATNTGSDLQYGMPAIYGKDKEIEPGRIYIADFEEIDVRFTREDILLVICCVPEQKDLPKQKQMSNSRGKSHNVYLEIPKEGIRHVYEYLFDLFHKETIWLEALWGFYFNSQSNTIKDYLDVCADMFDGELLFYPVGEWRGCVHSTSINWKSTKLSNLLEEDGKTYSGDADFANLAAAVGFSDPAVLRITDKYGVDRNVLVAPVRENGHLYVGQFLIPIDTNQATQAQIWHISRLRDTWEMFLDISSSMNRIELITSHGLLKELLSDSTEEIRSIKRHLSALGFSRNSEYICAIVNICSEGALKTIPLKQYCSIIETMENDCYAFEYESGIFILFNTYAGALAPLTFFQELSVYIKSEIQVGVSYPFTDILLLSSYAKQAKAALETGIELHPSKEIHIFADVATAYIMSHGTDGLPVRMLCAPGILELQKKSDSGGVDYIETLRVHMRNSCNVSVTARALHVHRSTLLYRLERINQVTQMDLNDPDDRLYLELSLALLHQY